MDVNSQLSASESGPFSWLQRDHFEFAGLWKGIEFDLLSTFDVVTDAGWNIERRAQAWNEIWLIRSGECNVSVGSFNGCARAGDAVLLTVGRSRATRNLTSNPLSFVGFTFRLRLLGDIDFLSFLENEPILEQAFLASLSEDQIWKRFPLEELLTGAVQESRLRHADSTFAVNGLAQLALAQILRAVSKSPLTSAADATWQHAQHSLNMQLSDDIVQALQFMTQHYAARIDVSLLARTVHLTPKHFSRKFKAALGVPPIEYLQRVRLQQAAQQLASSDGIGLIAARCGFENAAHFSRAFKAHFGITPTVHRQHLHNFGPTVS
ncbi:AraC family transcriptional regulator [bacterium]|nr:MAG: AraC family transcriptional regulator [bacterium]